MDLNVPTPPTTLNESQCSQRNTGLQAIVNGKIVRNGGTSNGNGNGSTSCNNIDGDLAAKNIDNNKRKKVKGRNATVPPSAIYQKDLDEWLESCLKDAAGPQLSSSSEFLDYNPSSFNNSKKSIPQLFTKTAQPQNFANFNFQKTAQEVPGLLNNPFNYNKMQTHHMQNDSHLEFASLPPIYGPTGDTNSNDNLDINDPTRSFRFSDPCLIAPSDNESKMSGKNTPDGKSIDNQIGNSKFLSTLLEQINLLHETNTKICRNLHETKVEIEALKHAPTWGLRHRRDSLSGLSTHSQPMGFAFGTQSPAPTYHSGMYTPGVMTDVIREVKEAARVREEALLSRVKAMVEERSWVIGEGNIRMMRDIEEMKAQIQHLRSDKKESNKRITQLETENKYIRSILASVLNNRTTEIIHENEILRSTPIRKNFADISRQKRNSFNLNYGTINYEDSLTSGHDRNTLQKSSSLDAMKHDRRSSAYGGGGGSTGTPSDNIQTPPQNGNIRMDNNLYAMGQNDSSDGDHLMEMEKNTLDLRRELQEALASKKQADNRIIALENIVKRLQLKENPTTLHNGLTTTVPDMSQQNLNQITTSQMPAVSPKLSLAGPITDL